MKSEVMKVVPLADVGWYLTIAFLFGVIAGGSLIALVVGP